MDQGVVQANPGRRRPAAKRLVGVALALLAASVGLLLLAHSVPARALALARLKRAALANGVVLEAGSLEYDLARLRAGLHGVRLAATGRESLPFLTAASIEVTLAPSALRGELALDRVAIHGARVALARDPERGLNLPVFEKGAGPPRAGAASRLGSLEVDGLSFSYSDPGRGVLVETEDVRARIEGGTRVTGELLRLGRPLRWRVGQRRGEIAVAPVTGSLAGATLRIAELAIDANEGRLLVRGEVARLFDAPRLDLAVQGELRLADLARWAGAEAAGALSVSARLRGPASAPEATIDAKGIALAWGPARDFGADARVRLAGEALDLERFGARWGGGRIDGQGRLEQGRRRSRLRLRFEEIELARLTKALPSPWAARLAPLEGAASGEAEAAWDAQTGWPGLELRLGGEVKAPAQVGAGRLALQGRSELRAAQGRWSLRAEHRAGDALSVSGDLQGALASAVTDFTLEGRLRLETEDLRRTAPLLAASPSSLPAGVATLDVAFEGTLGRPKAAGALAARRLRLAGVGPEGSIDGRLAASRAGLEVEGVEMVFGPARARAVGSLSLDGPLQGGLEGEIADLGALLVGPPGTAKAAGSVRATVALSGTWRRPRLHVVATGAGTRFSNLGVSRLEAELDIEGVRREDAVARGLVSATDLSWDARSLGPARLEADLARGELEARLSVPKLSVEGRGRLGMGGGLPFRLELLAKGSDLSRLAKPDGAGTAKLTGAVTMSASVEGRLGWEPDGARPAFTAAEVALDALDATLGEMPVRLEAPARMRLAGNELRGGEIAVRLGSGRMTVSGGLVPGGQTELVATLDGDLAEGEKALRALGLLSVPAGPVPAVGGALRASVHLGGTLDEPRLAAELKVSEGRLLIGEKLELQRLAAEAALQDGVLRLARAEAEWRGASLGASGSLPLALLAERVPGLVRASLPPGVSGPARLEARLENLPMSALVPAQTERAAGRVDARLQLVADAASLDAVRGELVLLPAGIALGESLEPAAPGRVAVEGRRLSLEPWRWRGATSDVSLRGEVRLGQAGGALAGARIEAAASGRVDLEVLTPFIPLVQADGSLQFELKLAGPLRAPVLSGEARVADGLILVRDPLVLVDRLQGTLSVADGRLRVDGLSGRANGGSITLEGGFDLEGFVPRSGSLRVAARGVAFEWPEDWRGEADAQLVYSADGGEHAVSGEVRVLRGGYRKTLLLSTTALSAFDESSLAALLGRERTALDRLKLDVKIASAQDLIVDTNYGRAGVALSLRSVGTYGRPGLLGRATISPGAEIYFGGATYAVQRAAIEFADETGIVPSLEAVALARVGGYRVNVRLSGPWTRLDTRLSSDPPLSESQIRSLLLTGSPHANSATVSASAEQALGYVGADVLGAAGRKLGFESVRLEREGATKELDFDPTTVASAANPAARLTFTMRVSPQLRLVYSQSLESSGLLTWIIAYEPRRDLETRFVKQDDNTYSLELRHTLNLGGGKEPPARPGALWSGERVGTVRFTGETDLDQKAFQERTRLRAGKPFDFIAWGSDRDRVESFLVENGYYESRVAARRQEDAETAGSGKTVDLEYEVTRGPRTRVRYEGFAPTEPIRKDVIAAWRELPTPLFLEQEAAARVRRHLFADGYLRCEVKATLEDVPERGERRMTVAAVPGPRSARREIAFAGTARVPAKTLRAAVAPLVRGGHAWTEPDRLRQALRTEYWKQGLFAADFTIEPTRFEGDRAVLPVTVVEGPLFRLGSLALEGARAVGEEELRAAFRLRTDEPLRLPDIEAAVRRLEQAYRSRGHTSAKLTVAARADRQAGRADLTVRITEGPRRTIREVAVSGLQSVSPHLVDKAVRLKPGDALDPDALAAASRRLYETGAFRTVEVDAAPAETKGEPVVSTAPAEPEGQEAVPVHVRVEEWPLYRLRYGLQFVRDPEPLADAESGRNTVGVVADVLRRNLFGRNYSIGLSALYNENRQEVRGYLTAPTFFSLPLRSTAFLSWKNEPLEVEGAAAFQSRPVELTLEQRYRAASRLEVAYGYRSQWVDLAGELESYGATRIRSKLARLTGTLVLDGRNDLLDPTRGYFHSTNVEWGGPLLGSTRTVSIERPETSATEDLDIKRSLLQGFGFVPVPGDLVLASAARLEIASGNTLSESTTERLKAGGSNTVRGYEEPPIDPGDLIGQLGGTSTLLVLNQEVRFPIWGLLRGVGFLDHSTRWLRFQEQEEVERRTSAGFGLRFRTPVGLIRLDYGVPLTADESGRRRGLWYLALGHAF